MSWVPWVAGFLALAFLLLSMNVLCRNIGFFHDELWDYIPTVGMIHSDSLAGSQEITLLGHPVPLVTGPYQGALKTWISAPLLMMLGTAPRTLRSLNVMFAMLYLAALYWALIPAIGKRWVWIIFAIPFKDPQIADFIRRIETERPALKRSACSDTSLTEFVLLTNPK